MIGKVQVKIPVIVCRDGTIATGWFNRDSSGKCDHCHDVALDCLDEKAFQSGYVIVHVEAELDIEDVLKQITIKGNVSP